MKISRNTTQQTCKKAANRKLQAATTTNIVNKMESKNGAN